MLYCISDIQGEYDRYIAMLEKIGFSADDTLFVLGDVTDRGSCPCDVLLDMMSRENVVPLLGNHDAAAAYVLNLLAQEVTEESIAALDDNTLLLIEAWLMEGGEATLRDFQRLSPEERNAVLSYLMEFQLYEEVVTDNGNEFVLVHGGLENFSPERDLSDYSPDEIIYCRTDYSKPLFCGNKYLVTGHTPTQLIPGNPNPGYIYRANNHIAIDCGATFKNGRLGCICLDTGEECYT